jgi:hypothetical protein
MPTWLLSLLSFIVVFTIGIGAIGFPYVPMFFGVHGAERGSFRGKLIVKLLWIFPLVSIACLYVAWSANGLASLIPFAYFATVWSMRIKATGPIKQYATKKANLVASLSVLENKWNSWQPINTATCYLSFTFFAPSNEKSTQLKYAIVKTEKLRDDTEISSQPNGTCFFDAYIELDAIDINSVTACITRMMDVAWNNSCELWFINIMEDQE